MASDVCLSWGRARAILFQVTVGAVTVAVRSGTFLLRPLAGVLRWRRRSILDRWSVAVSLAVAIALESVWRVLGIVGMALLRSVLSARHVVMGCGASLLRHGVGGDFGVGAARSILCRKEK